jgi:hypothetical protein
MIVPYLMRDGVSPVVKEAVLTLVGALRLA